MSDLIVADAGPLIGLAQIGLLPLLRDLYYRIAPALRIRILQKAGEAQ